MIFSWFSKLFLLFLISTGLLLGCQIARQSSVNELTENSNTTDADEREPDLSSQRVEIKSEEDARRVLQEDPLFEADTWTGYYHSTLLGENEPVLDGTFQIVSERTVPDYSVPIRITYTGQYQKGVRYGEFVTTVDGVEAETKYRLVYGENGNCQRGIIYQKGEGMVDERVIENPSECSFKMLQDTLYGL
ncbi:hypothetical protein H1P_620032 [Hyella patelloides LEGE 07179]|uniref:Uncharacterized protein n=1 Tax=Hyella patelloides LEGE 07179 TaxID=945734 RepID=A0A563W1W3_9CYAN|nr:hypothetical protein [Hyella patelloides]VEP17523.1 hypothetical protein H1P_620032 [Hyella patelloides LEGE 07179]